MSSSDEDQQPPAKRMRMAEQPPDEQPPVEMPPAEQPPAEQPPAEQLHVSQPDPPPSPAQAGPSRAATAHIEGPHLLSLPDSLILSILANLPEVQDRLNLAQTSQTLNAVVRDHSLWHHVRAMDPPMHLKDLKKMFDFLSDVTRSVSIRGFLKTNERTTMNVSESFFDKLVAKCPNLLELDLKDCLIDRSRVTIHTLPSTLRRLALRDCELINPASKDSWFRSFHETLSTLSHLDLSGCGGWLRNHCLMALCKSESLEELNLRGCFRIGEAFAYTAIATRFGFRNLKRLDLRDTNCGSSEIASFGRLPKLEGLKMGLTAPDIEVRTEDNCESDGVISDKGFQYFLHSVTVMKDPVDSSLFLTFGRG